MASKAARRPAPPSAYSYRKTLQEAIHAKTCYFYKDGDYKFSGVKVAVHPKRYRRLETLYSELSNKMRGLPYGVRSIFTPRGRDLIRTIEGLEDDGHYVCSTFRHRAEGLDVNRVAPPARWNYKKPPSGLRDLNSILHDPDLDDMPRVKRARYAREQRMAYAYNRSQPKKITVLRNGDPTQRHILLINRRTAQTFDQILSDLSEMFQTAIRRLHTMEGRKVMSLTQLFNGPEVLVAAGKEPFKLMVGVVFEPHPPAGQPRQNTRSRLGANDFVADKLKNRRDRLMRTKGQWKVWVTTNELATAGTTAQVTLTVYGHKGQTNPLPLGFGDSQHFQNGHIDEFDITVGSVGEIYKIRIGHDNTGDFPGWLCDEVRMRDKDTGEELVFPVKRWMSREEDDFEICRELPVNRRGDPHLPVIKYEVSVVTGNLWNAGTDANVYLTVYGDRGDTGVRQLYSPSKDQVFRKGQTDHFTMEAVSLGKLKRVIVGHDGTNPGDGWFLEKIMIQEPEAKAHDIYTFYCNRWLDEGEDDGKIVREVKVQDEYMDDILSKRNRKLMKMKCPKPKFDYKNRKQWEFEKWKFENKNQVVFFSLVTGKALRIKSDGTVDGLGEETDPGAIFTVSSKKPMVRIFTSLLNHNFHLAIDNGKIVGHGRGGPYCEFRLHIQNDLTVMLEGVKSPLQFISLLDSGKLGDPRGILDREPGKRFHVYCKGMLRHRGIIMLRTSNTQAINVDHDLTVYGTGRCNRGAHFRVHKVDSGGVRLFESMTNPGKYLRLVDGKIDCQGGRDEKSHFIVEKHRDKGYVTVQSKTQRGIFLGLTPKGEVRPTVDTGVNNVWLFPEVIEFGVSRQNLGELTPISEQDTVDTHRSPEPKKKQKSEVAEGDWKVTLDTIENLENGQVALVVYGDKGQSGPIMMTPPVKNGPAYRAGSSDEFKANLLKVGQVYKVRLELVPQSAGRSPTWKVGHLKMQDLNGKTELLFKFDRWLSRSKDDGEIMRELPVVSKGKEVLPVCKYEVRVYTGKEDNADTKANVYLNLFGEHGDCGKRQLIRSNNKVPFQRGQVDKFELEAVSLGALSQCLVGHDGTRSGDGWYLETIVVRDGKNSGREYVFPCNKWLDSGREDRKIERLLSVKEDSDSKPPSEVLPVLVEKEKTAPPEEEKPEVGSWRLLLTTGKQADMGCMDTVVLYAYGSRGSVGPVVIGNGEDGVFEPGSTDEFKIVIDPEKTGKLYKIRVGLAEQTFGAQWFLEKVIMVDLVDGETLQFQVQRWLSRKHDDYDVWRELPVARSGETPLPVHQYQLQVHTGDVPEADTEAEIFVTMFGERGDSGRRRLFKSKSDGKAFTKGKVDVFTVEAVSLGQLSRLVVGHGETTAGEGWYLADVTVAESDKPSSEQTYFPCNRWLDAGKDDHKTEVELVPGEKPQESKGEYQLWVKTAPDSSPANGGKVSIAVYGSQGHRKDIELFGPKKQDHPFEPGNIDEFEVALGEIGEIQKLRVHREETPSWKAWHLEEIKMKDRATGQTLVFVFDRWFSRDMDDHDLVRELPALKDNKPVSQVCHYEVTTSTGDHWAGGTDATVYITLIGSKGDCGKRTLYAPDGGVNTFRVGQEDKFELEAVDLGDLTSVVIGHDGKGHGAGWYLDKVVVKVRGGNGGRFVFPCLRWLDVGEDDGKIERELRQIDMPDLLQIAPMRNRNDSPGDWQVYVRTSDIDEAATCAQVYLTVYGSKGASRPLPLGDGSPNSDNFWRGKESVFKVNIGQVGEIRKIRLEHDNRNPDPSWHVESVRMVDAVTEEELFFPVNRWLAQDKDDGQLHRECPVMSPGVAPVPVLRYLIAVQTGRQRSAGASEGWISVNLIGRNGDTGQQLLQRPLSNPADKMVSGKLDVYMLEAVSVGTLQNLRLVFEGKGKGKKWYVERVMVLESVGALEEAVFDFNCWLQADGDNNAKEVPLSDMQMASSVTDDIAYRLLGCSVPESEGRWEVTVWTGSESDAGTKDSVLMVLYGTTGHTEPKTLNKDFAFNPGSVVKLQVDAGRIGPLFKIRLLFGDRSGNSTWSMNRLKLKDMDTGQEFHFDENLKLESTPQSPDGATEVPAIRPDIAPLPETTYLVTITTGKQERAETEAEIFCTLIGQWGDTGEKILSDCKSHREPFQRGQTDRFELKSLYLGTVKKLLIGHNESGRGCGWFCQQVTVQSLDAPPPDKKPEVVFVCNRWLDSGCEDRRLVRELMPTGQLLPLDTVSDKAASRGVWRCSIKMAAEDKLDASLTAFTLPEHVSLVVYGSRGVQGPLQLQDSSRDLFLLGQTDQFDGVMLGDIGDIQKLRVCAGREDDDNPVWMVEQVVLEDQDSHEVLRFDFSRWVGQVGGDIQHELPVLVPGQQAPAALEYEVQVQTENSKEAGTKATIFINIHGKNGDSGRRRLVRSSTHSSPFQAGQTDVFIIEAVDLGDLDKVVVTKGPGNPWQLNQVKVRPGRYSSLVHVFIWSNSVGSHSNQTEEVDVTIPVISSWPAPVAIPAEQVGDLPTSGGQWTVEVLTGEQGALGEATDLVLVMCGDRGESSPIKFHSARDRPFQPRQNDTAEINLAQDVGDLIKVRLGFADNSKNKALHIARLKFEDVDTHDNFSYVLNSAVEVNEISDGWKEFPVVWPAVYILPVVKYKVEVTTGSVPKGDTEAQVYIELHGRMGSTGRRQLKKSLNNDRMFQLGQTDVFEVEAVSLMSVDKVLIGHHSASAGDGWFLKRVSVTPHGEEECVFECNRWLDGGEDDGRIERTLNMMDEPAPTPTPDLAPPLISSAAHSPTPPPPQEKAHKWQVWTTTGSEPNQGTSSLVVLVLYGDKGHTEPMVIGNTTQLTFRFTEGETQEFEVGTDVDVGKVYKVRVGFHGDGKEWYSNFSQSPSWYLERLKVQEVNSGRQYVFEAKRWLRVDHHHDHWREFPVYTKDEEDMLQVHDYCVEVYTGDKFGAGTDANVYLEVCGDRGDTGQRHLHGTRTDGKMFERKMHDVFLLEAVDLGHLRTVKVSHDGSEAGSGWFLDRITVKQSQDAKEKYVFNCDRWLDVDEDDGLLERELPLTGVVSDEPEASPPKAVKWEVIVMTGAAVEADTDAKVTLTVFGDKGSFGPHPLELPEGTFNIGQTDSFNITLDPDKVGKIQKIRLQHDNSGDSPDWLVTKVLMKSETGDNLEFPVDRWLSFSRKNEDAPSDIVFEAAAEWPGEEPLQKHRYLVKTVTPNDSGAGTDADVYVMLVGSLGDSGIRELKQNLEERSKFQPGSTDSFVIEAVDLGRLEKVVIGLKNPGFGSSWKLQCVIIRVSEKESFVFPWGKFLNDENPEAEILLAEVVDDYTEPEITGLTPRDTEPNSTRSPQNSGRNSRPPSGPTSVVGSGQGDTARTDG